MAFKTLQALLKKNHTIPKLFNCRLFILLMCLVFSLASVIMFFFFHQVALLDLQSNSKIAALLPYFVYVISGVSLSMSYKIKYFLL